MYFFAFLSILGVATKNFGKYQSKFSQALAGKKVASVGDQHVLLRVHLVQLSCKLAIIGDLVFCLLCFAIGLGVNGRWYFDAILSVTYLYIQPIYIHVCVNTHKYIIQYKITIMHT